MWGEDNNPGEFWDSLLKDDEFKEYVKNKFSVAYGSIMGQAEVVEETEDA